MNLCMKNRAVRRARTGELTPISLHFLLFSKSIKIPLGLKWKKGESVLVPELLKLKLEGSIPIRKEEPSVYIVGMDRILIQILPLINFLSSYWERIFFIEKSCVP